MQLGWGAKWDRRLCFVWAWVSAIELVWWWTFYSDSTQGSREWVNVCTNMQPGWSAPRLGQWRRVLHEHYSSLIVLIRVLPHPLSQKHLLFSGDPSYLCRILKSYFSSENIIFQWTNQRRQFQRTTIHRCMVQICQNTWQWSFCTHIAVKIGFLVENKEHSEYIDAAANFNAKLVAISFWWFVMKIEEDVINRRQNSFRSESWSLFLAIWQRKWTCTAWKQKISAF